MLPDQRVNPAVVDLKELLDNQASRDPRVFLDHLEKADVTASQDLRVKLAVLDPMATRGSEDSQVREAHKGLKENPDPQAQRAPQDQMDQGGLQVRWASRENQALRDQSVPLVNADPPDLMVIRENWESPGL